MKKLIALVGISLFTLSGNAQISFLNSGQSIGGLNASENSAIFDCDADGDLDVVTVHWNGTNAAYLHKNDGTGTMTSSLIPGHTGGGASGVDFADIDGDLDLDICVTMENGTMTKMYKNDGTGNFSIFGGNLGIGTGCDFGDVDGDGDMDVVIFNRSAGVNNSVWTNDGLGNFVQSQILSTGSSCKQGLFADIDGDSDLDVVAGLEGVWKNDGTGVFTPFGSAFFTEVVCHLVDVDGDLDMDCIGTGGNPGSAYVYKNDGVGNFALSQTISGQNIYCCGWGMVGMGDVDQDGDEDMYVGRVGAGQEDKIYLNDGAGNFSDALVSPLSVSTTTSGNFGDLDGDGDLDLFLTNYDGAGTDQVWFNTSFVIPTDDLYNSGNTFDGVFNTWDVTKGDIDGDSDIDLIYSNNSGNVTSYINDGSGNFSFGSVIGTGSYRIDLVDVDGDNDLDLLGACSSCTGEVWKNDGSGNFTATGQTLQTVSSDKSKLRGFDIDNDGDNDAVWVSSASAEVWENDGTGIFTFKQDVFGGQPISSMDVGDVNNDGFMDFIYGGNSWNTFVVINDGTGTFNAPVSMGNYGESSRLGDVDNDGDLDVIAHDNYNNYYTRIALNNGDGTYAAFGAPFGIGFNIDNLIIDDFNQDGSIDIYLANYSATQDQLWLNNGCGVFSLSSYSASNVSAYTGISGDFDGNGMPDIALAVWVGDNEVWLNNITPPACAVADQTVNATTTSGLCSFDPGINLTSSECGVSYFIRDNGTLDTLAGPFGGNGGALTMPFTIDASATVQVYGSAGPGCNAVMTTTQSITSIPPTDQTINTASFATVCSADTTIELASSQVGIDYFLRNDADNTVIDGPVTGIGGVINLSTGNINSTATYNIWGKGSGSNDDGALDFDGIDDQVIIANNASLDLSTNEFTIEYWANPSVVDGNFHWVAGKENNNSDLDYLTGLNSSNQWRFIARNLSIDIVAGPVVTAGTWYHVACVFDGATASLYVNGILVGTDNTVGSGVTSTATLKLGARNGGQNFAGTIDDVRLWNSAKSDQDINVYMDECLTGTEPNLVAFYNMSDGTGSSTLTDQSLNTNNGALTSMDSATDWVVGKSCNSCSQEMSSLVTITIDPIADQTIFEADWASCDTQADSLLTLNGSQIGVNYYLRDDADDSVIDGPIAGNGGVINFNTGAIVATTTYNVFSDVGMQEQAIDLPSANDHVRFSSPFTAYGNEITVEAWVYNPGGLNSWAGQSTPSSDNMGTNVWLWHNGTWFVNDNGTWRNTTMPALPAGWTHVATVADGTSTRVYYNGALQTTGPGISSGILNNPASIIDLGHDSRFPAGTAGRNSNVSFDDFRVWDVARTPSEIASSMNSCLAGTEPNLVQYTEFVEGTGTTVAPVTGSSATVINPSTNWIIGAGACGGSGYCSLEMTDQLTVTINLLPTVTAPADFAVCDAPNNVTLTGAGTANTYAWNPVATDGVAFTQAVGTTQYVVTGTITATGCQNTDTVDVTVNPLPTVTAPADITMCAGDTVLTGSGTANTYAWDNSVTDGVYFTPPVTTTTYTVTGTITATGCQNTDQVDITVNPLPSVNGGVDVVLCDDGTDTTLTGSGTANTYVWDLVTNGVQFSPALGTTTHIVTGTITATGCQNTDTVDVVVNPLPTVSAGIDQSECANLTVTLTGSGTANTYAWDGGVADATPFNPAVGSTQYIVTGTITATGCENTDTVDVTGFDFPVVTADSVWNASCFDTLDGQAFITVVGGTPGYLYDWDHDGTGDNDDLEDQDGLADGTYNVTVEDANGCLGTSSSIITEPAALVASIAGFTDPTACATPDGTIDAAVAGGTGPYTYDWDNDGTGDFDDTEDLATLLAGNYILVVVDDNGCLSTVSQSLSDPSGPVITIDGFVENPCFGDSLASIDAGITGGLAPYTIDWDNDGTGDNDDTEDLALLSSGTYVIVVTDVNGCIGTNTQVLTDPAAVAVAPLFTDALCNGDSTGTAVLNATGGTGALIEDWGTSNPTMLEAGWHFYTVTDDNGCVLTDSTEIMEPTVLTAVQTVADISCYGLTDGSIDVTPAGGTGPYDVVFEGTDTTTTYSNLSDGTYGYTVTDANGCSLDSSASIVEPAPLTVSMTVTHEQAGGDGAIDLTVSGGTPVITFDWDNDGTGDFDDTEDLSGLTDGTYIVVVQDGSGCSVTDTAIVDPSKLELGEAEELNFSLYPNPNQGTFVISFNSFVTNGQLTITDVAGKLVHNDIVNTSQLTISLDDVERGIYHITLITENNKLTKQFVKQ